MTIEAERIKNEIQRLQDKLLLIENSRYRVIMDWTTYESICEGVSCKNCILFEPGNECGLQVVHNAFRQCKEKIANNGGSIRRR